MNPLVVWARPPVEALGWTLLHFVWQGAALALVLVASDLVLARARASTRYAVACGVLLLTLALPVATFISLRMQSTRSPARTTSSLTLATAPRVVYRGDADRFSGLGVVSRATATPSIRRFRPPSLSPLLPWLVTLCPTSRQYVP